jgi:hypothetical protein
MNRLQQIALLLISFLIGFIYFAFNQGWIVINPSSAQSQAEATALSLKSTKKQMNLIFWNEGKWDKESVEIIATADPALTVQHLVTSWLTLLDEEGAMSHKITLQAALMSANRQLYLSFDRTPFDENSSTHDKWMWIEGVLATIKENEPAVHSVHFLVHHLPLEDNHLDFSNAWPISGFLASQRKE